MSAWRGGGYVRAAVRGGVAAAGGLALVAGLEVVTYPRWRSWCLSWGATSSEAVRALSGDELLADPAIVSTRAVQVGTPPSAIWPWLVQMGPGRGGAYTYDWIENLFGLGMHSADEILPQYQDLKVGDAQRLGLAGRCCEWPYSSQNGRWCSALRTVTGCGLSRWFPPGRAPG